MAGKRGTDAPCAIRLQFVGAHYTTNGNQGGVRFNSEGEGKPHNEEEPSVRGDLIRQPQAQALRAETVEDSVLFEISSVRTCAPYCDRERLLQVELTAHTPSDMPISGRYLFDAHQV